MLNNVILMGRLTADPEIKPVSDDKKYVRLTLAVNRGGKGEDQKTDFIDCVAWNRTAEFISKYFSKGKLIALKGSIRIGSYTDKEGVKKKSFNILINEVYFTGESKLKSESEPDILEDDGDLPF